MGGKSKTTVVQRPAPKSSAQLRQEQLQVKALERQIKAIEQQTKFQGELFGQFKPLVEEQIASAKAARAEAERFAPVREEVLNLQLENLRRGGRPSEEQLQAIEEARQKQLELGESDISTFTDETINRINQELAGSLGLRPGDSPIGSRRADVVLESQRQQGQLARQLAAGAAQAELNLPLASQQIFGAQNLSQQGLLQSSQQFQQQLAQAANLNRQRAAQTVGGLGIGTASLNLGAIPANTGLSQTTTQSSSPGIGGLLGGAGGFLSGVGAILP